MKKIIKLLSSVVLALTVVVCVIPQSIKAVNNENAGVDFLNATQINIGSTYTYHGYGMTDCNDDYISKDKEVDLYFKFDVVTKGEYQFKISEGHGHYLYDSYVYLYDDEYNKIGSGLKANLSTEKMTTTLDAGTYYLCVRAEGYTRGAFKINFVETKKPYINLSKTTTTIGDKVTLSIKNKPSGSITWVSGNTSVAVVSSKGKVTAKKEGKAVIFAIINNNVYKCNVTVKK